MFIGPIFSRELVIAPRRRRLFYYRSLYATGLLVVMATAWLVLAGTQVVRSVGDMARFGATLFLMVTPLQLALVGFFSALFSASAVAQEKDRQTLILLLMTRLNNSELVLGKLLASLLHVLVMVATGLPILMLCVLFGGVDFGQVWRVTAVTLAAALVAGSLGTMIGLWREKTFQTLALTALVIVFWLGLCEALQAGLFGDQPFGWPTDTLVMILSPFRAVLAAADPFWFSAADGGWRHPAVGFVAVSLAVCIVLCAISVACVRLWNPSRQVHDRGRQAGQHEESIWGHSHEATLVGPEAERQQRAEWARGLHVDARVEASGEGVRLRRVWTNPILWREVCTWAYGRKVLIIRAGYLAMALAVVWMLTGPAPAAVAEFGGLASVLPPASQSLAPLILVSLVIINALAVNSVTNERDGRSLDLLLVTDLTPREFIFGKLGGVLWVTKEMVLVPLAAVVWLWWQGRVSAESLLFLVAGLLIMDVFVGMLGLHCGMIYASSRSAIAVSLGTVFFLFLGVVTCLLMLISFSGSFQLQYAPFFAFIAGGGVGLYAALGVRNPSPAMAVASGVLPLATFHAIVSFMLQHTLTVFLVVAGAYGFATAAMMIPALAEFDLAMGRTGAAEEA